MPDNSCGATHPTKGTCNRLAGHVGRHHAYGLGTLKIWSDEPDPAPPCDDFGAPYSVAPDYD